MPQSVYVLGAGFTKAFLPRAPLRVDDFDSPTYFDGPTLEEAFAAFPTALEVLKLERRRSEKGMIDIERLMSRLDGGMPFDSGTAADEMRLLFADLKRRFVTRIKQAREGVSVPDLLVRFARHCIETAAGIVTFNHDDFLDEALWQVRRVTDRGASGLY